MRPLVSDAELTAMYGRGLHPQTAARLIDEIRRLKADLSRAADDYYGAVVDLGEARAQAARLDEANEALGAEVARLREHSVQLNSLGWRLAEAVGDVGPEDVCVVSDPFGRLERLIAERDELKAEKKTLLCGGCDFCADDAPEPRRVVELKDGSTLSVSASAAAVVDGLGHVLWSREGGAS